MKKRTTLILLSSLVLATCVSCTNKNERLNVPFGYTLVDVSEQSGRNTYGFGVEFDPHFFSQNVTKGVVEEDDWEIIENRVKKMEIDHFRVMVLPSWLEPLNDNNDVSTIDWNSLTTDSIEMQSLYKVLDLAQRNDIDVNLVFWGVENGPSLVDKETSRGIEKDDGHFLGKDNNGKDWIMGTKYPEEFAENISIYLQHLITKGYTCIKRITPINEPDWSYTIGGSVDFEEYKTLVNDIDERLMKDGLRDKIQLNLSDNTDNARSWLESTADNLDDVSDVYNSHTYIFGYESTNKEIESWEKENLKAISATNKQHLIGEFGSNQTKGSSRQKDIDLYERGILMVRQMLNFYNAGAAGVSYWTLFDQYYNYNDPYKTLKMFGLWKGDKQMYVSDKSYYDSIKNDYEVRPQYYALSLISKHVQKNTNVYPIYLNDDYAIGTAFKGKDGKWTYVFANGNEEGNPLQISFRNNNLYEKFNQYIYEEDSLPSDDSLLEPSASLEVCGQVLSFKLKPQTVMLFSQK